MKKGRKFIGKMLSSGLVRGALSLIPGVGSAAGNLADKLGDRMLAKDAEKAEQLVSNARRVEKGSFDDSGENFAAAFSWKKYVPTGPVAALLIKVAIFLLGAILIFRLVAGSVNKRFSRR